MAVNCTAVRDRAVPLLHGQNLGALTAASSDDIFRSFNLGAAELAKLRLFGQVATPAVTSGNPLVAAPTRHVATLYAAWLAAGTWARLPRISRARLEALDPAYRTRTGATPTHLVEELEAGAMRVYPTPTANLTLLLIYLERRADVSTGSPTLAAEPPVADYLLYRAIGDARRRNADEGMADVAAFCDEQAQLYAALFRAYSGR